MEFANVGFWCLLFTLKGNVLLTGSDRPDVNVKCSDPPRERETESDAQSVTGVFYRGRYRDKTSDVLVV